MVMVLEVPSERALGVPLDLAQEALSEQALVVTSARALEVPMAMVLEVQSERARGGSKDLALGVSSEWEPAR